MGEQLIKRASPKQPFNLSQSYGHIKTQPFSFPASFPLMLACCCGCLTASQTRGSDEQSEALPSGPRFLHGRAGGQQHGPTKATSSDKTGQPAARCGCRIRQKKAQHCPRYIDASVRHLDEDFTHPDFSQLSVSVFPMKHCEHAV